MGIVVGYPLLNPSEKDLQLSVGEILAKQVEMKSPQLPSEWHPQKNRGIIPLFSD